jgi:exopolyphosphatase / guanosine-5'-triphosphate,3'-diphosphate pyrophosphatase
MARGEKNEAATRVAVVDIGSNSTRLLVADVEDGSVGEVERRTTVTRLGRGVDLSEQLSSEAVEAVCKTVADYVSTYQELDAEEVTAIATSAVRDASNGGAFIAELRERFDLDAKVLDGEREARLTYMGATAEEPPSEPTLVVDIGGGSTELVIGTGSDVLFHTSLQAGVVRHTERRLPSDPPTAAELEALADDVRGLLQDALEGATDLEADSGVAVAGTPTSLAAIDLELEEYDPERVHGHVIELPKIQRMLSTLASLPLAERREVTGLHPDRAPNIVAGVVILVEAMRAFGLGSIRVSEHDILHGAALEAAA